MNEYTLTFPGYQHAEPRTFRAKDIEAARKTAQRLIDQWRLVVEARGRPALDPYPRARAL